MESRKPAALFDFDGTLTCGDTLLPFVLFILRHHPVCVRDLPGLALRSALFAARLVSKEEAKGAALQLLARVGPEKRASLVRRFHDQMLVPRYRPGGLARLRWHRAQGHTLVLVSASVDAYLGEAARRLGFDTLVCTRSTLEPRAAIIGRNCHGPEKVARLKELDLFLKTDWKQSYAYSDHPSDLPMLQLCGHPAAVNPRRALLEVARIQGWEILDWRLSQ